MPTITIPVGQAGNQLACAWWQLLQCQQEHFNNGLLSREWFRTCDSSQYSRHQGSSSLIPRIIIADSEAKVIEQWAGSDAEDHQIHILGHGGCGNNWACGYQFGASMGNTTSKSPAWSGSTEAVSKVDQVLEGVRKEAETIGGVSDFLMMGSLAGGTGSGTGSILLEALADEYPASTLAAVAVAPGHTGDNAVQSINSCLALHHFAMYAHAVVLLDNQSILNQLNSQLNSSSNGLAKPTSSPAIASSSRMHISKSAATAGSRFSQSCKPIKRLATAAGASSALQPMTGRACLAAVNQVAAELLVGLLWPLAEEDGLSGRSNIRQLASTICSDPVNKFVEVCHAAQPAAAWASSGSSSRLSYWNSRIKPLSSQLPRFDPCQPTEAVTTSAALIITRGVPGTTTAVTDQTAARPQPTSGLHGIANSSSSSWWLSSDTAYRGVEHYGGSRSSSCWQEGLAEAVCSSWPYFTGETADLWLGSSAGVLWSANKQGEPSMTAAVRRSSIGSFMRAQADRARQLCDAGAYLHWYEQYGCDQHFIRDAAHAVDDMAEAYFHER